MGEWCDATSFGNTHGTPDVSDHTFLARSDLRHKDEVTFGEEVWGVCKGPHDDGLEDHKYREDTKGRRDEPQVR